MQKFFSRENWAFYFKHPAVRWNVCYLLLLTIISLCFAFTFNWVSGIVVFVIALVGGVASIKRLRRLVIDANEYLNHLMYQIKCTAAPFARKLLQNPRKPGTLISKGLPLARAGMLG